MSYLLMMKKEMQTVVKFRIYPYKQGSRSAKALSEALGGKVLKHVGSKYKPRAGDVVINWGSGNFGNFGQATTLNPNVKAASCKLASFQRFSADGVRTPRFWTDKQDIPADAYPVMCRTVLRGHSGAGIVVAENAQQLVPCQLYTQYVKKKDEYRVHVLKDKAFFIQRKARKLDVENPNWQVRNLAGGFVFVEVPAAETPADVLEQAVKAIQALGLDFGGVDVMWNEREEQAYVLEVNTACGLEDRTAAHYRDAFVRLVPGRG
jgi:hypothetical protein